MNNEQYDFARKILNRKKINLDITHRCPLECQRCQRFLRFTSKGLKVPGKDLAVKDFQKIINHFSHINFCGQVSDPVHHPKFITFLKMLYEQYKTVSIHHATAAKPMHWYEKAFETHPSALWWFGIDGLPNESHIYRINQDGEKLFEIMKLAATILYQKPIWQYIVFNYNEDHIEEARKMAKDAGVKFMLLYSSRWLPVNDSYRPKNPEYSLDLKK